jgi:hypothetical protein
VAERVCVPLPSALQMADVLQLRGPRAAALAVERPPSPRGPRGRDCRVRAELMRRPTRAPPVRPRRRAGRLTSGTPVCARPNRGPRTGRPTPGGIGGGPWSSGWRRRETQPPRRPRHGGVLGVSRISALQESDVSRPPGQARPPGVPWTSRASRSKTGFGVKGERFTPKAGHDPGIVSPEAGSLRRTVRRPPLSPWRGRCICAGTIRGDRHRTGATAPA